jgi:hypothetical protein
VNNFLSCLIARTHNRSECLRNFFNSENESRFRLSSETFSSRISHETAPQKNRGCILTLFLRMYRYGLDDARPHPNPLPRRTHAIQPRMKHGLNTEKYRQSHFAGQERWLQGEPPLAFHNGFKNSAKMRPAHRRTAPERGSMTRSNVGIPTVSELVRRVLVLVRCCGSPSRAPFYPVNVPASSTRLSAMTDKSGTAPRCARRPAHCPGARVDDPQQCGNTGCVQISPARPGSGALLRLTEPRSVI